MFFMSGEVPEYWKSQVVIPILKSGKDPRQASFYRPIALSAIIGKIFEHLVKHRLEWLVESKGILANTQFGFRKGRSTLDSLTILTSDIRLALSKKQQLVGCFLDISSAYDNVQLPLLRAKLLQLSIPARIVQIVCRLFMGRIIKIRTGNTFHPPLTVWQGLPQGSVLSPLLYNLYTFDVEQSVLPFCNILQYADDLVVYTAVHNLDDAYSRLNEALVYLKDWLDEHGVYSNSSSEISAESFELFFKLFFQLFFQLFFRLFFQLFLEQFRRFRRRFQPSPSEEVYNVIDNYPNTEQIEIPSSCNSVADSEEDDNTNTQLSSTVNDKRARQGKPNINIVPYSSTDDSSSSDSDTTPSNGCHNNENDTTGSNIAENNEPSCNNKGTRKRKAAPESWIRNTAKRLKNNGKSYTSRSNRIVPEKTLKPPCTIKCKRNCTQIFTETQRKIIFENYWEMGDLQRQREYILRHISPIYPKYSYKVHNSNRGHNNAFYFTVNQQRIRVCKTFFKATLDITDRVIRTVIQKTEDENDSCVLSLDQRGKHTNHKTVDPEIKDSVREHINRIPRVESHYCRACTTKEYIDGGKSIADLHRDYTKERELKNLPYANYLMYNHIFNEHNISFYQPKKDQCEDCVSYANSTEAEKAKNKDKFDTHINEKMLARSEKDKDKKYSSNTTIVCVYDLQATMPCPKGDVSTFYYLSKLNVYNFTICNMKDNNVSCYVWHEGEARRGVAEIGTCVMKYIEDLKVKAIQLKSKLDVIFYSDNCTGQHKNHFMIALYVYVVNNFEHINSITHKFLIKGHTQNEGDSAHSVIERNNQEFEKQQ
ncbi:uncharacterized protein LOC134805772 [Cydia splendana]|uniref:uncharacterized protein LOC134805772 n=1 Tax=Cydia splendana TaxID=1100963 RepID=UPI00300D7F18